MGAPMSKEAKESARIRAGAWYAGNREMHLAKSQVAADRVGVSSPWTPEDVEAAIDEARIRRQEQRSTQIKAFPVIHDADRFERIQEVMASNREKKYGR